ncbi:MAG: mannitol dehydrogenase family protein [Pseudomonadota bacterium]|nr:mannitol dehydrogenase family protein [Pseudomonadota bacterium]
MGEPGRLSDATLGALPAPVERPRYDRAKVSAGIVHLGIGAFHRAHQAACTDAVLAEDMGWGIVGASLRSAETRDALSPQDGLYTLAIRSGAGETLRVIGAVTRVLVAPEDPEALIAAMADPRIRIVSLTVTEKGYCHDPATGGLNEDHPDVIHDLRGTEAPRSAPGIVIEALARRRSAGLAPFTVLSCDNLPSNGRLTKRILRRFAQLRDPALGAFVEAELGCPSSMVDRITPATTDDDRAGIAQALGVLDAWPVITEPFTQWVIEDRFPAGRPHWERAGAELVADVEPYELMKLRLLNGPHSTLAYLGYLAGYQTVAEVMADEAFGSLVQRLMDDEITPTLAVPPGVDIASYTAALRDRFRNPALKHRTWQIAMDGSQKLPQRLLGSIRDRLRAGASFDCLALGVAAWMRYVTGVDEKGNAIDVRDPLAAELRAIAASAGLFADRLAPALLRLETIFGSDLPEHPRFVETVTAALDRLLRTGTSRSVADVNARRT